MQLYTKTGDQGMTKLIGGGQVSKDSDRVQAYGTIDELNTWVGLCVADFDGNFKHLADELQQLQQFLFDLGTDLANPELTMQQMKLNKQAVDWLESKIDYYQDIPPAVTHFILPGGSKAAALLQVCRTITRRAERKMVTLNWTATLPPVLLQFINRLSDYFYALARFANFKKGVKDVYYEKGRSVFKN